MLPPAAVFDHDGRGIDRLNRAGFFGADNRSGVIGNRFLETGTDKRGGASDQGDGLALLLSGHQSSVTVVISQEGD